MRKFKPGELERWAKKQGLHRILGVDEVGVSPLAGPVVAAAICLPDDHELYDIDDSKRLSEAKRNKLYDDILFFAKVCGIGVVSSQTIDDIGIRQATFLAWKRAVVNACEHGYVPQAILVDGQVEHPDLEYVQFAFVKGDNRSWNIAAASIVAKVTRDRLMTSYSEKWPEYEFAQNKGYSTPQHKMMLKKHGLCAIHRNSFRPVKEAKELHSDD
jgi:ribonuclease HII